MAQKKREKRKKKRKEGKNKFINRKYLKFIKIQKYKSNLKKKKSATKTINKSTYDNKC